MFWFMSIVLLQPSPHQYIHSGWMAAPLFNSYVVFQRFTVPVQSSRSPLSVHNNLLCTTEIDTVLVLIWIVSQQLGDVFFSCSVSDLQQESGIAACWCFTNWVPASSRPSLQLLYLIWNKVVVSSQENKTQLKHVKVSVPYMKQTSG